MDIEAARRALKEPGRRSWDEVRAELVRQASEEPPTAPPSSTTRPAASTRRGDG